MKKNPSIFQIEQYLAGELGTKDSIEFENLMESDPRFKSYVDGLQAIRYDGLPLPVLHRRPVAESILSTWRAKMEEFLAPLFPPQVAWAMGLCLLAGAVLVLFRPERMEKVVQDQASQEYTAKGSSIPFHLRVGSRDLQAEQSGFARAGDTMAFVYRSLAGMHVQIWYQDDGGEVKPYLAPSSGSSGSSSWLGVSAWHEADYKVVLFSDWQKESVWILWSDKDFSSDAGRKFLVGDRSNGDGIQKVGFNLVRTP